VNGGGDGEGRKGVGVDVGLNWLIVPRLSVPTETGLLQAVLTECGNGNVARVH